MRMSDEQPEITVDDRTLVAYRLGRLEKQVEESNRQNVARHESLIIRLDDLNRISQFASENRLRIEMLEKSRDRLIGALAVVATGTIMLAIQTVLGWR